MKTIYDLACGTGGMLWVAEQYIRELNSEADPHLFGQDWNDESWAVCKSEMRLQTLDPLWRGLEIQAQRSIAAATPGS